MATNVQTLKQDGFTAYEVKVLLKGWKKGIDSPAFKAMREARKEKWAKHLAEGYTRKQIWGMFRRHYKKPKRSPFDWLREIYDPTKGISEAEFRDAAKKRTKAAKLTKTAFRLTKTKPRGKVTATVKGKQIEF